MNIPVVKWSRYRWIHLDSQYLLTESGSELVEWLKTDFGFGDLDLEDSLAEKTQRPKWESQGEYSFFILHFASINTRGRIEIQELKVFVGETFLITIGKPKLPVADWFEQAQIDPSKSSLVNGKPGLLLYRLVDRLTDQGLANVRKLGSTLDSLDQKMAGLDKRAVDEVSLMRRNLIIYTTTLKPMGQIFSNLEKTDISYLNGNLKDYWGSISDHFHHMYDSLSDYRELLDGLTEAYEMLLTQKTNEIIRLLTIFSVMLLPLTLVASIYGMNISLPYENHQNAFSIVSLIMLTLLGGMLGFFRWKKWL